MPRRFRKNILRPQAKRESTNASRPSQAIDIWLSRGSSIAQIFGVGIALAGIFYTVIPLYQKAAVDEQLARRESELKDVEEKLVNARAEAYRLRRVQFMLPISLQTADDCTGIRRSIMQPALLAEKDDNKRAITLDVDIEECVAKHLESALKRNVLSGTDGKKLYDYVLPIAKNLELKRRTVAAFILNLPVAAAKDPSLLGPEGYFTGRFFEHFGDRLSSPELEKKRFESRVRLTQQKKAADFSLEAATKLRQAMSPTKWANDIPDQP
jgi:hypothetical protein